MKLNFIGPILLLLVGIFVGVFLTEVGLRIYLIQKFPHRFISDAVERPNVWFFSESRWSFDKNYGYVYGPETVHGGSTVGGAVTSCWYWPANPRGNMGIINGDYNEADIKIAVFGDSFTAQIDTDFDPRGITWPDFLQQELVKKSGKKVHVLNFGRDGTGILHMSDLAADMVKKWSPDIVIFAFITDDLTRDRFWRTVTSFDGRERIVTTTVPEENPPYEQSADTAILHKGATKEWCEKMIGRGVTSDKILLEMESTVQVAKARIKGLADIYTYEYSYLFNFLFNGDAFYQVTKAIRASQNPRHKMTDFSQDERFKRNMASLRSSDAELVLFHLAVYEELASGVEYKLNNQQQKLLSSLESEFQTKAIGSLAIDEPTVGYAKIKRSVDDSHPSVLGMKFYANAASEGLFKSLVDRKSDLAQ